jgi:hypothetical protein
LTSKRTVGIALIVAIELTGCGGYDRASSITAPSTPPPPSAPPTSPGSFLPGTTLHDLTLSGIVFEQTARGRLPIEGVGVYCEACGEGTHTWGRTDVNGVYSFRGVWTGPANFPISLYVFKEGYADPEGLPRPTPPNLTTPGWREVLVNGSDTQFDIELVRR